MGVNVPDPVLGQTIATEELITLCAVNTALFASTFFSRSARHDGAVFFDEDWELLDNPTVRYLNLVEPRGFAKTTRLRIFTAKRIAYGLSRTILYVGASEDHARRSIMWLQRRIATRDPSSGQWVPTPFATAYGLRPGQKWNELEIEIITPLGVVWVLGAGITGNIRGINFDDYRPDLVIVDDALTDENTATPEQCIKINDLVFKALKESLAPRIDDPNAKMVLLNTPHNPGAGSPSNPGDLTVVAQKDETFVTRWRSCWTPETADLDIEDQRSAWEAVKPTEDLRREKRAAQLNHRYSGWAAENECRLIQAERAAFLRSHLRYYETKEPMFCVVAIDPVPPPSDKALATGMMKKDYEAVGVIGRRRGEYHLLDYKKNRGHNPSWTFATASSFALQYRAARFVIQGIAYERTLKWYFEQEMARIRRFWPVNVLPADKRSKYNRIVSTLQGVAENGRFFVDPGMSDFISQWETYPAIPHEDLLDMVAVGMTDLVNPYLEVEDDTEYDDDPYKVPLIGDGERATYRRMAP